MSGVAVVVGNPKPASRTLAAATYVARELAGQPDLVANLAELGPARLDWSDPAHALAPELTLRPVLTELGATVPGRGRYVLDSQHDDPSAYASWLAATGPVVTTYLRGSAA